MNKKYLDASGVQHLWKLLSLQDYPNNETLIAVINAIDETKVDKTDLKTSNILHDEVVLFNIINDYILNIDYDTTLAFDTSEIVVGKNPTPILGKAILGCMVLTA